MRNAYKVIASGLAIVAATATVIAVFGRRPTVVIVPRPATQAIVATTLPTSKPAPPKPMAYLDAVRAADAHVVVDKLLDMPVLLDDAARLRMSGPIYLDTSGHLWITRAGAAPVSQLLAHWTDTGPTVLRERPVFVHWANDAAGAFVPTIIFPSGDGYDFIIATTVHHWAGPRNCDWTHAFSFGEHLVIPTPAGVTVLDVSPTSEVVAHPMTLPKMTAGASPPVAMLDSRGILAWSPWEQGKPGSGGAMRFIDGQWSPIDAGVHLVQMVPLLDGSLLTLRRDTPDHVTLAIEPLESTDLDRKHLADLIEKLADDDPDVRESAYAELSRYGPGLWPVLEQSLDDAAPEAKQRIQRLLRGKIAPALGGMVLIDGKLDTVHRQPDGTAIFYAPGGIEMPGITAEPIRVVPAWIVLHPGGRFGRPIQPEIVADQTPEHFTLIALADDWYVCDAAGPRRFLGGNWQSLLKPEEAEFDQMVGQDTQGRWLFKTSKNANQFLLLDPTLLDPTPKLPVWSIKVDGTTGMDKEGWPTITHDKSSWALHEGGWATTGTPAAAKGTTAKPDTPLLVCADGTKYFDGQTKLVVEPPHGSRVVWPLPSSAQGTMPASLVRTEDGHLFLFNASGRVIRIKTGLAPKSFTVDATFTHDIPNAEKFDRVWIDPAGRIACTFNGNQMAVMFLSGHMPVDLTHMQVNVQP